MRRIPSYLLTLALLAFMAVGCAKEEAIGPCHADESGTTKSKGGITSETDPSNSGQGSGRKTDKDGASISDDGDDVGDGERNRKKKPS
jgi:hypothetical protein